MGNSDRLTRARANSYDRGCRLVDGTREIDVQFRRFLYGVVAGVQGHEGVRGGRISIKEKPRRLLIVRVAWIVDPIVQGVDLP